MNTPIPINADGTIAELSETTISQLSEQQLQSISDSIQKEIDSATLRKSKVDPVLKVKRDDRLKEINNLNK